MSSINLPRTTSRWRFTLSGLLLFTLSISVGLAWWRLPGTTFAQFLYGCFAAWFVVGMAQWSRNAWSMAQQVTSQEPAVRTGLAVAIAAPICIALFMVFAILMDVATRIDWFQLNAELDDYEQLGSWILRRLTWTAFFLSIVCGYLFGDAAAGWSELRRTKAASYGRFGIVAGILLMGLLFLNTAAINAMVWEGITGLENYQPTRWAGHEFHPWVVKGVTLQRAFVSGGLVSMPLLLSAVIATLTMARRWNAGVSVRAICCATATAALAAATWLLWWCVTSALPVLSVILSETITKQPTVNLVTAILVVIFFAAAVSLRAGAKALVHPAAAIRGYGAPLAHEHPGVLAVGLTALLWELATGLLTYHHFRDIHDNWYRWADLPIYLPDPEHLLWLVALILLGAALLRSYRGLPAHSNLLWSIEPANLVTVWALLVATLLLVPPVGAWFGLALMLQAGMP